MLPIVLADYDECSDNANLCGLNGTCHNYPGYFICFCDFGFTGKHCESGMA